MTPTLLFATFIILAVTLALGLTLLRVFSAGSPKSGASVPCDNLVYRYRPMERLLDESDYAFIAVQRGISSKMVSKLRAERRKIFRGYLRSLRVDYSRVCFALQTIMVDSSVDRPDLASLLFRSRVVFTKAVFRVEIQLAMHTLGVGTVQAGGLVQALENMRLQVLNATSALPQTFSATA